MAELQKTFYQPPGIPTIKRWREETPPNFEFTLKAWQLITHPPTSPTYRKLRTQISDDKKEDYGSFQERTAPWKAKILSAAYGKDGYRYRYTDKDLLELKEKWAPQDHTYFMINNVYMWEDAKRFKELMKFI